MKITKSTQKTVPFSSLKIGDIFKLDHNSGYLMKINDGGYHFLNIETGRIGKYAPEYVIAISGSFVED